MTTVYTRRLCDNYICKLLNSISHNYSGGQLAWSTFIIDKELREFTKMDARYQGQACPRMEPLVDLSFGLPAIRTLIEPVVPVWL
jgi:hypothetical protein